MKDGRPLVTVIRAMAICQVSRRTIYHWIRDGKIQWVRTAGGQVRIFSDTLFVRGNTEVAACEV